MPLNRGFANCGLVFVNKVLGQHSLVHSFTYSLCTLYITWQRVEWLWQTPHSLQALKYLYSLAIKKEICQPLHGGK